MLPDAIDGCTTDPPPSGRIDDDMDGLLLLGSSLLDFFDFLLFSVAVDEDPDPKRKSLEYDRLRFSFDEDFLVSSDFCEPSLEDATAPRPRGKLISSSIFLVNSPLLYGFFDFVFLKKT